MEYCDYYLSFMAVSVLSLGVSLFVLWQIRGHVAVGMARRGYDLQLTRYDEKGWRATFYTTGMEHSPTSATGTGWSARRGMRCKVQRGSALLHASITPGGTVQ